MQALPCCRPCCALCSRLWQRQRLSVGALSNVCAVRCVARLCVARTVRACGSSINSDEVQAVSGS